MRLSLLLTALLALLTLGTVMARNVSAVILARSPRAASSVAANRIEVATSSEVPKPIEEVFTTEGASASYVAPGSSRANAYAVFLHGMCSRPTRSLGAFANALREKVTFVAPQGDVACEDGSFRWSDDVVVLSFPTRNAWLASRTRPSS